MYGDEPACWGADLRGWARLRYITNALTRMRYCDAKGCLELTAKGPPGTQPAGLVPWFQVPGRVNARLRIVFGHWSTLALAPLPTPNVFPLDSGCVWRQQLTALRLEDGRHFHAPCAGALTPKGY
jgi:bis(5'-nucleosyl)-tetraphosphatase (symmetrical)